MSINYWVVGADWDGTDKVKDFIDEGIWQNGYSDKFQEMVKQVQAGDKIAIKAVYGRKYELPFNNFGCFVSCMRIKAIGEVIENLQDGRTVRVSWLPEFKEKVIYYYTYRSTITRIVNKEVQGWIFKNLPQPLKTLETLYQKRASPESNETSDEFILDQFRQANNFHHLESNPEEQKLFIEFVRYIHLLPLDWWMVNTDKNTPIRFGINEDYGRGTSAYVARVGFDQQGTILCANELRSDLLPSDGEMRLDIDFFDSIKEGGFGDFILSRKGCWPSDYMQSHLNIKQEQNKITLNYPKNLILFGAAGTGKTYHTINHAISIIDGLSEHELAHQSRKQLKQRYDELVDQSRIRFVTFHQSFSYEDFVEGIRAESKNNNLTYPVKPGVFKKICEEAAGKVDVQEPFVTDKSITEEINNFIEQAKKQEITLKTKTGIEFKVVANPRGTLSAQTSKGTSVPVSAQDIRKFLKLPSDLIIDQKSYEWAIAKFLRSQVKSKLASDAETSKPYVLIIDEINRGNISRVFGELITLIEDSKRAGASEALSVTLPYSGDVFSVPSNVYIIGTMNSSDRSLTGLDMALRRRFTFVEMPPNPQLLNGVMVEGQLDIGQLLRVMNERIEVLLDRDHCIGHAYFMPLKEKDADTLKNLKDIFLQKVIPLLQEYFFDDWAKINLVLNDNKMLITKKIMDGLFKSKNFDGLSHLKSKEIWRVNSISDKSVFDDIQTYENILTNSTVETRSGESTSE